MESDVSPSSSGQNRRRVLKGVGTAIVGGSTAISGCLSGDQGGTGTEADEPIQIGVVTTRSGPWASLGEWQRRGLRLGVQHINDDGGIMGRDLELLIRDAEADPNVALRKYRQLLSEDINFAMSGISSSVGASIQDHSKGKDVLLMHVVPAAQAISGEACIENGFNFKPNTRMDAKVFSLHIIENNDSVFYFGSDYNWGQQAGAEYKRHIEDSDTEWLGAKHPPFGADDFAPFFESAKEQNPDAVIAYIASPIKFIQQMDSFGLYEDVQLYTAPSVIPRRNQRALGEDLGSGIETINYYHTGIDTDINQNFVDAFQNRFGKLPNRHSETAYAALHMFRKAVGNAESTEMQDVISEMRGLSMKTPQGTRKVRKADNQVQLDQFIMRSAWQDGGPGFEILETIKRGDVEHEDYCDAF